MEKANTEHQRAYVYKYLSGGILTYVNPAFSKLVGVPADQLIGHSFHFFLHPDDRPGILASIESLSSRKPSVVLETRVILPDGRERYHRCSHTAFFNSEGRIVEYQAVGTDITETRRAEELLRKTQENLKRAEKIAKVGNWEWDIATNQLSWSDEVYRIYGVDPALEKPSYDIVVRTLAPEDTDRFVRAIEDDLTNRAGFEGEYRMIGLDGVERFTHTAGEVIRDQNGNATAMFGIVQDITSRKRIEIEHAEQNAIIRQIMDTADVGIALVDMDGRFTHVNKTMADMFRALPADLHGTRYLDYVHPEEKAQSQESLLQLISGKIPTVSIDRKYLRKDGTTFWGHLSCNRFYDGRNCFVGLIGVVTDITNRKQFEEQLREGEARLNTILGNVGAAIFLKDTQYRYTYANYLVSSLFGVPVEEIIGKTDQDFFLPESVDEIRKSDRPVVERGETISREEHALRALDNRPRTYWTVKLPLKDASGAIIGLCGISTDITEQRAAELKIRESDQFIRNILDSVDEGFIVVDRDYKILTANRAYCNQVGESHDTVIGNYCYSISHHLLHPCSEEGEECAVRHVFETGEPHTAIHRHIDSRGAIHYVETKAFPIKNSQGDVTSAIETVNNITEKQLLEEERLKTQKLASIGTLAGGIAHDFNNLLQGVFGYISVAKNLLDNGKARDMLENAEKALNISVNLTSQLLTFAKGGHPVKKRISPLPLIENAIKLALSGSRTSYTIQGCRDLFQIEADEGQIGQVIHNIVLNADQAMPYGGTMAIAVRNVRTNQADPFSKKLPDGDYIEIAITDTGIGIPQQFLSRIFDPYFTTKEKGTGLGLATAYSIISNHGGIIEVHSQIEKGSTFLIYLPSAGSGEELTEKTAPHTPISRRKILVMDDEDIIRLVAEQFICALGHEVELAEHGAAALEKYSCAMTDERPFDAVILDLTIKGGMGGAEAMEQLRQIDPNVKAVVSSGYSDEPIVAKYLDYGFCAFLKKPYTVEDLSDLLSGLFHN